MAGLVLFSLVLGSAFGAPCAAPVGQDALLADLDVAEVAAHSSASSAGSEADRLIADLSCLSEGLPPMFFGRAYRAIGAAKLVAGDEAAARAWFGAAVATDPSFEYGSEIPFDHAARFVYTDISGAGVGGAVTDPAHTLAAGEWTLDGKPISAPRAVPGVPHVLQRHDANGVQTWRIDGIGFPDEALAGASTPVSTIAKPECPKVSPSRRYYGGVVDSDGDGKCDITLPKRPGEKTALILAGGVMMGGAGGVYALAGTSRERFETASVVGDVIRYKTLTNQLVVVSGLTLAVGAATLGWGVIVSDGGAVVPRLSGRF